MKAANLQALGARGRWVRWIWALFILLGNVRVACGVAQTDALGHRVVLDSPPRRIISLSPSLTEILFTVGVSRDRIVGVTRFCDYPPAEVAGLPRVGGIVDPAVEAIVALHPDLVLATRGNPAGTIDRLRGLGITVFAFESQGGLDLVLQTMREMTALVRPDHAERADSAIASFARDLACLRAISKGAATQGCPKLYYYDPASPNWTAGRGTHVSEAIALGGGCNVADRGEIPWPSYSVEALLVDPPDWILVAATDNDTSLSARDRILEGLLRKPGWRKVDAVRDGKLCLVPADWLLRPGPRLLPAIQSIGRCIHPDVDWGCSK